MFLIFQNQLEIFMLDNLTKINAGISRLDGNYLQLRTINSRFIQLWHYYHCRNVPVAEITYALFFI